jgi:conjugal transfer pilin signal peptidase TrbI
VFHKFWKNLKDLLYLSPTVMNTRQKIRFGIFMLTLIVLGITLPSKFAVSITKSLDHRIYYISRDPSEGELHKGDYIIFFIRSKYFKNGEPIRLIKQIACDEGEYIIELNRHYYCVSNLEGHTVQELKDSWLAGRHVKGVLPSYIGKAKEYSLKGDKLDKFDYSGVIPKGYCFVAGHHKDSFDSRYWGFVKKSEVKAKAYPII